ncbi:hypothetical protein, partial [Paraburkholderia mimosarum]|uniref:hypothetical protein n=1 Tax=Paraburkholderia mimosarum TaxID=312026 RepID=UPI001EE3035E
RICFECRRLGVRKKSGKLSLLLKERLMRNHLSLANANQLTLFLPEPNGLTWEQVPAPVREELTRLLANLLVLVVNGRRDPDALCGEANNE